MMKNINEEKISKLVVFVLAQQRFALPLSIVDRIVQIVEITHLPKMPEYIMGVINIRGEIIPVVNIRKLFNLPDKKIELSDQLLITKTSVRKIALWVDSTDRVVELEKSEIVNFDEIMQGMEYVQGVFKLDNGMVLIHDVDKFLSTEELILLKKVLEKQEDEKQKKALFLKQENEDAINKNKKS